MTQEEKAKAYDEVINKLRYLIEQGIYPLIARANVQDYSLELKENEDERIRKAILEGLIDCRDAPDLGWSNFGGIEIDDCIAWLEKLCNKPQCKSALEAIREEKVDNANKIEPKDYSSIDPYFGNPIDKVNPKFHEGEWTVSKLDRKARQISEVHFDEYNSYYVVNGKDVNLEEYDRLHHLWTINDAKDGDVLVNKNGTIFINAGSSNGRGTLDCYCYLSVQNEFCIEEHKTGSWLYKNDIKPATKEQCDLLFTRMKEAGCEWDVEKKELRKEEVK